MGTWVVRVSPDAAGDGAGPRLAVKDCIDVAGLPTTAGCPVVAEMAEPAQADAAVVASAREAGARIVGKTSLTELCWSVSGVNHWTGTPANLAGHGVLKSRLVMTEFSQTSVIAASAAATLPDTLVMHAGAHRGRNVGVKPARLPDGGLRV